MTPSMQFHKLFTIIGQSRRQRFLWRWWPDWPLLLYLKSQWKIPTTGTTDCSDKEGDSEDSSTREPTTPARVTSSCWYSSLHQTILISRNCNHPALTPTRLLFIIFYVLHQFLCTLVWILFDGSFLFSYSWRLSVRDTYFTYKKPILTPVGLTTTSVAERRRQKEEKRRNCICEKVFLKF